MGASLVQKEGADHFDIHDNVAILHKSAPHLIQCIHSLLEQLYFSMAPLTSWSQLPFESKWSFR